MTPDVICMNHSMGDTHGARLFTRAIRIKSVFKVLLPVYKWDSHLDFTNTVKIYLFINLFIYLFTYLFIYLLRWLFVSLFINLSKLSKRQVASTLIKTNI